MSNLKNAIQLAFDTADSTFEAGHLTGDQVKDYLQKAMAVLDADAAQLMEGKKISAGTFQIKEFPIEKLKPLEEPVFTDASESVQAAGADGGVLGEGEEGEELFDAETFVTMSPKDALEKFGIDTINNLVVSFKVEVKDGANDVQKTAALIAVIKNELKKK